MDSISTGIRGQGRLSRRRAIETLWRAADKPATPIRGAAGQDQRALFAVTFAVPGGLGRLAMIAVVAVALSGMVGGMTLPLAG